MKKIKNGFTLIELLVVIAIMSLLIVIGTSSYQKAVKLSRDSRRKADLEQIRQALETYRSENGQYPNTTDLPSVLETDYIAKVPTDPKSTATSTIDYQYTYNTATTYTLCADLELPTPGTCNYSITNP